jgi:flagellar protein FliL
MAKTTKTDLIKADPEMEKENPRPGAGNDEKKSPDIPLLDPGPERRKKPIWIVALAALVLLGGAAFACLQLEWISIPGLSHAKKKEPPAPDRAEMGAIVKLTPLVINLKEESGRHYLKVTVVLEVVKKDWVEEVNKRMSSMTDTVLLTLSDKQLQDLRRPESKEELKKELLTKINEHFDRQKISRVYFDEFLYQ